MSIEEFKGTKKVAEVREDEKTKTCAKCGAEVRLNANFCNKCGNKFEKPTEEKEGEKTKICKKCGTEVHAGANFCNKCGNKFENTSQETKISKKIIIEKDGKPAISVEDFLRMSKTMDIEEIATALEESSKKDVTSEKEPINKDELESVRSVQEEGVGKNKREGEKSLEDQKKEAESNFLKVVKSHEILVGDFPEDEKKKLVEKTLKEITEAKDEDFVGLAVAGGMKKSLELMKDIKKQKKVNEKIGEIRKDLKGM